MEKEHLILNLLNKILKLFFIIFIFLIFINLLYSKTHLLPHKSSHHSSHSHHASNDNQEADTQHVSSPLSVNESPDESDHESNSQSKHQSHKTKKKHAVINTNHKKKHTLKNTNHKKKHPSKKRSKHKANHKKKHSKKGIKNIFKKTKDVYKKPPMARQPAIKPIVTPHSISVSPVIHEPPAYDPYDQTGLPIVMYDIPKNVDLNKDLPLVIVHPLTHHKKQFKVHKKNHSSNILNKGHS